MELDLNSKVDVVKALAITAISTDTTTTGEIIDSALYESLTFAVLTGTITDGSYAFTLQEGDESDLSDASTVATADILGSLPTVVAANDDVAYQFGYIGKKRYVRLAIVSTSTSTGGTLSATAVKGDKRHQS